MGLLDKNFSTELQLQSDKNILKRSFLLLFAQAGKNAMILFMWVESVCTRNNQTNMIAPLNKTVNKTQIIKLTW
jgi:hypothetical protein